MFSFQRALLTIGENLCQEKKQCLFLIFFRELCSAMHFWKIWTDNNCNFATDLDPNLLLRSWVFFCYFCHTEENFLTQAGAPSRCPNFWRFSLLPNSQLSALPQCFSSSVSEVVVVVAHVPSGRFAFRNIHN